MAFTAKILSWRFRHLNIVGCLLKRRPTKGGSRAPQDLPLATHLLVVMYFKACLAQLYMNMWIIMLVSSIAFSSEEHKSMMNVDK